MTTIGYHTDTELFALIAAGDEKAFTKLYKTYVPRLLPFISRTVRSDSIADEVVQQVFLSLWIGRDKLPEVQDPKAWIFRIAANICYSHLKKVVTERRVLDLVSGTTEQVDELGGYHGQQARELSRLVHAAIELLPAQRKKIYELSRDAGLSHKEIADQLGISSNTVKNTMVQALQFIRLFLKEHGYEIPIGIIFLLFF